MEKMGLNAFYEHNYKIPQKPQEKKSLKERIKLKLNLHISRAVISVPQQGGMVTETGDNTEEWGLSKDRDFSGRRKPGCGKMRFLR